ncbi:GumC family protein [Maribacter sp. IgM3_T14_3]|uniref:GumC family protein n=1 Tax=Maribacter sp. IgM3_T14_3 TaxID=3415140 RepID=UPI003C6F00AE
MEQWNIRSLFLKYNKYWSFFTIGVLFSVLTVFMFIRYWAQTEYEIQGKILIKNTESRQGIIENNNFGKFGLIKTANSLEDEIGILTSTVVMEEVVTKNTFNITYFKKGNIRDIEIYGKDVPVRILVDETTDSLAYGLQISLNIIDSETFELSTKYKNNELYSKHDFGELITLPYGTFTIVLKPKFIDITNLEPLYFVVGKKKDFITNFLQNLSVHPDNETGSLLNVNFIAGHQKKGEDILLELIETYIDKTIKYENELAENTIKMIDERLKLLSGEIEDVETSVADFKSENVVTDVARNADSYVQQSNEYKKQVAEYQTQINVLENIEMSLLGRTTESTIGGSFSINNSSLTSLINIYNATLLERNQLSQSAVTSNPVLVNLNDKLNNLRESILQNIRSVKNGYSIARQNLLSNASRYDAQIARVPGMEKKLLEISRDKSTKEGLYLFLLQKREEEVLSLATPVSSTRIVSYPQAGKFPISPNKKILYLTGLLFGFLVPFSMIFIKDAWDNKVTSVEDLTTDLSVPFLGEISRSKKKGILIHNSGRATSPTAELFQLLHFNLDYLKKTEKNQTLLVTSTSKGEGKTFISSNLAVTLESIGEKVILLAFDLREPQLMADFNLDNSPGISDFIIKKGIEINEIIQKHPTLENLSLIGSGVVSSNIGRLMLSKRIDILFKTLKEDYDRIIIDTPPIGLVSDAFALNKYIDSTIYVVRKDVTNKEHLKTIETIYKNEKLKNTMILLNDTKEGQSYGYDHH